MSILNWAYQQVSDTFPVVETLSYKTFQNTSNWMQMYKTNTYLEN